MEFEFGKPLEEIQFWCVKKNSVEIGLEKLYTQSKHYNPTFCHPLLGTILSWASSLMGTVHSASLCQLDDIQRKVGKIVPKAPGLKANKRPLIFLESKISVYLLKEIFFLIPTKQDISPNTKTKAKPHFHTDRAQFELFYSPQPDVHLKKTSVPIRMQSKLHKRELLPQIHPKMSKEIIRRAVKLKLEVQTGDQTDNTTRTVVDSSRHGCLMETGRWNRCSGIGSMCFHQAGQLWGGAGDSRASVTDVLPPQTPISVLFSALPNSHSRSPFLPVTA